MAFPGMRTSVPFGLLVFKVWQNYTSMKKLVMIAVLAFAIGCQPSHTLRVKSVETGSDTFIVSGHLDGHDYTLTATRDKAPLYVPYWSPIRMDDVGKDFPARENGSLVIVTTPKFGEVGYNIIKKE
jgi:hypothetical protein